eukprot:m51a1_g3546 hypothetical protein (492) ;mRNA; r:992155-994367
MYTLRLACLLAAACSALALAPRFPEAPDAVLGLVTERSIRSPLRFVGSAALEGRLPGSRGETLAAMHLTAALEAAGVEPAGDAGGYFQRVPLEHVAPASAGLLRIAHNTSGKVPAVVLEWFEDYVGSTQGRGAVALEGEEMVFAGYGIADEGKGWDDYKGLDVRGRVVVALVSQPSTGPWAGLPLEYSARTSYKYAEAARRGAKAVLLVHTLETASYPWGILVFTLHPAVFSPMYTLRLACLLAAACSALALAPRFPEAPDAVLGLVTERSIRSPLRFVGSAALEGRLPGSRGETLAAMHLAAALEAAGVEPAGDAGGYFQRVPLEHVAPASAGLLRIAHNTSGKVPAVVLEWFEDYVGSTQGRGAVALEGEEMVFAGYGIADEGKGWDDYKGLDVRGRVVVALVSQPSTGPWAGLPLEYSARTSYKYAEAARRGAMAVLLVHTLETASYPWGVVQNSNSGTETRNPADLPDHPLTFAGWARRPARPRPCR